jgi:hypothetical protein
MATKKSKALPLPKTDKSGKIGPKNQQNYGNKGKAKSMPKFGKGGMVGKKGC